MSIQALPQTTVRAIGASQVLTDPAAVVKELIDNALDARATIVGVEIHANTLDVIQVRDNGRGISPHDRPLVARRYCTSKITGEDDLKSIGGSSLGFRGEALASAAELSGSMTITTRIEGEEVATALKISQQGEITGQERASTPIGTTVRITDFIKTNPVRKQVALKRTEQCLKRVKQLLQGYAFARLHVRLSLRVLKAKNEKGNWTYAPKLGGNAEDAAFKIVGAACASQCIWSVVESHGFRLEAFLPKVGATVEKVSNVGAFVSIDGRPVSVARGTPKQIIKIFREMIRKGNNSFGGIKDPFIYLEIVCPEESYDANIEPAKDDVLFEDPDKVVEAARQLFTSVYPSVEGLPGLSTSVQESPALNDGDGDDGFVTSSEHQPKSMFPLIPSTTNHLPRGRRADDNHGHAQRLSNMLDESMTVPAFQSFRSNVYDCDEGDLEALNARPSTGRTEADSEEFRQARNDVNVSNPWVMAQMNTTSRHSQVAQEGDHEARTTEAESGQQSRIDATPAHANDTGLPTPRPSSPGGPKQLFHPSNVVPDAQHAQDVRLIGPSTLPAEQRFTASSPSPAMLDGHIRAEIHDMRTPPIYRDGMNSDLADTLRGTPLSTTPRVRQKPVSSPKKQSRLDRPLISPVTDGPLREKVWFDHLEGVENRWQPGPRRHYQPLNSRGLGIQGELGDLIEDPHPLTPPRRNHDIRDFVNPVGMTKDNSGSSLVEKKNFAGRRAASAAQPNQRLSDVQDEDTPSNYGVLSGRGFMPASELAVLEARMGSLEHSAARPQKRLKTGKRVLRQISGNAPPAPPLQADEEEYEPEDDTRPVSRPRSSVNPHRAKLSKLPLERIPTGKGTHNLALKVEVSSGSIVVLERKLDSKSSLLAWNQPAVDAYDSFAVQQSPDEIKSIGAKLHELLINRVNDGEMVQDIGELVDCGLQAHGEMRAAEMVAMPQAETEMEVSQV